MVEVSPAQKEKLDALRRKSDITFIVAFGSRVKGVTHARSDLDIGILCATGFDAGILGELLGAFPGEEVDVALLNRADPLLLKGVSDAAVLLSGEERDLQEFRMYAFRRYAEHRPFFALEERVNARHLAGCEVAINPELVHRKITLILEDLEKVRSLAALAPDEYLSDPRNEVLAERYLERIIGRAIDINYHLVTEMLLFTPKDYWDSFIRLSQVGVLDPAAVRSFARLAGLKNRITYEYNGLDETLIHEALGRIVRDLPEYLRQVTAFLAARG